MAAANVSPSIEPPGALPADDEGHREPARLPARGLRSLWRRVWSRPEPEVSDVAASGELMVAGLRLLLVVVLLYLPAAPYLRLLLAGGPRRGLGGDLVPLLAAAGAALLGALLVYTVVHRNRGRAWIGFASSLLDVSLITGVLLILLGAGRPEEAVSDPVLFSTYLLAIAATALRYDARISLVTGGLAVVQYGAVVWLAAQGAAASGGGAQAGRMAQLVVVTLLAAAVVVRSRELRLLSTRDRFTGLLNRAVFDERLAREALLARHDPRQRFVLAMVDIDHFKRFNDTHGHVTGDQALRQVAELMRESCRATDVVARYGGEEFALVLSGARPEAAYALLERIRRRVAAAPIRQPGRVRVAPVTVSIGFAVWPRDGVTPEDLLAAADRRLYQAKQQGRDRVVGPHPPKPRPFPEHDPGDLDPPDG